MLARRTRLDGLKIEHTASTRTSAAFGFARWEFAILGENCNLTFLWRHTLAH
jgi:hypothetical protein